MRIRDDRFDPFRSLLSDDCSCFAFDIG